MKVHEGQTGRGKHGGRRVKTSVWSAQLCSQALSALRGKLSALRVPLANSRPGQPVNRVSGLGPHLGVRNCRELQHWQPGDRGKAALGRVPERPAWVTAVGGCCTEPCSHQLGRGTAAARLHGEELAFLPKPTGLSCLSTQPTTTAALGLLPGTPRGPSSSVLPQRMSLCPSIATGRAGQPCAFRPPQQAAKDNWEPTNRPKPISGGKKKKNPSFLR